jgi:hypothetical protein
MHSHSRYIIVFFICSMRIIPLFMNQASYIVSINMPSNFLQCYPHRQLKKPTRNIPVQCGMNLVQQLGHILRKNQRLSEKTHSMLNCNTIELFHNLLDCHNLINPHLFHTILNSHNHIDPKLFVLCLITITTLTQSYSALCLITITALTQSYFVLCLITILTQSYSAIG